MWRPTTTQGAVCSIVRASFVRAAQQETVGRRRLSYRPGSVLNVLKVFSLRPALGSYNVQCTSTQLAPRNGPYSWEARQVHLGGLSERSRRGGLVRIVERQRVLVVPQRAGLTPSVASVEVASVRLASSGLTSSSGTLEPGHERSCRRAPNMCRPYMYFTLLSLLFPPPLNRPSGPPPLPPPPACTRTQRRRASRRRRR